MALMNTKFTGDQMYRALASLREPAAPGRTDAWLTHVRLASANVAATTMPTVQGIVAEAGQAALDLVLPTAANMTWLRGNAGIEPLSVFRHLQPALSAASVASPGFVAWMVAASAPAQILRAAAGAAAPLWVLLAGALDAVAGGGGAGSPAFQAPT